ncbi:MAG: efflux RND transporter periplasmic adaptor subunit [Pseudomonadota bacterium]
MRLSNLIVLFATCLLSTSIFANQEAAPVFVATVERVEFVDQIEALGTLKANENVNLTSTVTERITNISFEDNQRVDRGDVLIQMDIAQEQAELAEEQSRLQEAQNQVNRLRPLVERGAASNSVLDEQEREFRIAQARIKAINSRISERRIVAPFEGVVGIRNISVGDLAQPGTVLVTVDDDSVMKLDFSIPEIFLATLKPGIEIEAQTSAYPGLIFKGNIASVDSRVDPVTRSVTARALLDNDDHLLKAGMLMRVILNKNPREAVIVPEEAIITIGNEQAVMVIEENENTTAERQVVTIGERRKGEVEILSGLEEGQQIVTHGAFRLRPGAIVDVKAIQTGNESLTELLSQKVN